MPVKGANALLVDGRVQIIALMMLSSPAVYATHNLPTIKIVAGELSKNIILALDM